MPEPNWAGRDTTTTGGGGGGTFEGGTITPTTDPGLTIDQHTTENGLALVIIGSTAEAQNVAFAVETDDGAGGSETAFSVWSDGSVSVNLKNVDGGIFITDSRTGGSGAMLLGIFPTDPPTITMTLPTTDPASAGALWNSSGVVHISAG